MIELALDFLTVLWLYMFVFVFSLVCLFCLVALVCLFFPLCVVSHMSWISCHDCYFEDT